MAVLRGRVGAVVGSARGLRAVGGVLVQLETPACGLPLSEGVCRELVRIALLLCVDVGCGGSHDHEANGRRVGGWRGRRGGQEVECGDGGSRLGEQRLYTVALGCQGVMPLVSRSSRHTNESPSWL